MSADADIRGTLLAERAATHGDAERAAITYWRLRQAVGDIAHPEADDGDCVRLLYPLDMILVKIARIASGDPRHEDHWADIAGYATMAQNMVKK